MYNHLPIKDVYAREILDSRGNPTIEVEVLAGTVIGRAAVPSGASTGKYEAAEIRDGEARYLKQGVQMAAAHVNDSIASLIIGENVFDQGHIDHLLIEKDGTENKSNLGANAILGTSMAVADAAARALNVPLYTYFGGVNGKHMPVPMMNILNGGKHADNTVDIQEFMIMPTGAVDFQTALQMGTEIYHTLKRILKDRGYCTSVGDEGGFAPDLPDAQTALEIIVTAIESAGYKVREEVVIALDIAASELYNKEEKLYVFAGESEMTGQPVRRTTEELIDYYVELVERFPILSLEDPLDEEDWEGWELLTTRLGMDVQLVADDLFVTNTKRLQKGIDRQVGNAILIKVNQIGTLTEAFDTIEMAKNAGYKTIISHRSGETEDTMIADIAVAFNTGQIKTGAPCRSERVAKYNQLLRIEERVRAVGQYKNPFMKYLP